MSNLNQTSEPLTHAHPDGSLNPTDLNDFEQAKANVFVPSIPIPSDSTSVCGPDFNHRFGLDELLGSYKRIGFQASSLHQSIEIINNMVSIICFPFCPLKSLANFDTHCVRLHNLPTSASVEIIR